LCHCSSVDRLNDLSWGLPARVERGLQR
jgi:hypothetical protein